MNYLHSYHAGNFCDVVKHICLIALIESLMQKQTPICYIDTHAGAGVYDLFSEFSEKTKEYENGIEKIIQHSNPPDLVKKYLQIIHILNNKLTHSKISSLRYYPGSPQIVREMMRPHDRIIASELHPNEYQSLKNNFLGDTQVAIHHMDGFLGLKAFLPPKERRGVVLIDPPYEDPDEFMHIARLLPIALKRFETGVYAIWYPVKEQSHVEKFYETVKKSVNNPVFTIELTIYPDIPQHLNGCGMAIINPPWKFDEVMKNTLPWVWKALSINGQGKLETGFL
ncbi:MAG TPA: 23S rRNA (adenine(2030)-N(6))-methyltransferase RlmJ [Gammaproteobacteria bacterium]|jgi:23S rRNA (adenine2030-N6)-methyltransferase|nr:23S rRNA (adenine(2030)-N(6))-methyltransferase RlmJ [Gammaproteobacteria bacterium]